MVVVSWWNVWIVVEDWSSAWVVSSSIMRVPPPLYIRWSVSSFVGVLDWGMRFCFGVVGSIGI